MFLKKIFCTNNIFYRNFSYINPNFNTFEKEACKRLQYTTDMQVLKDIHKQSSFDSNAQILGMSEESFQEEIINLRQKYKIKDSEMKNSSYSKQLVTLNYIYFQGMEVEQSEYEGKIIVPRLEKCLLDTIYEEDLENPESITDALIQNQHLVMDQYL